MEKLRIAVSIMPGLPADKVTRLFEMGYDIVLDEGWTSFKKHPARTILAESFHFPDLSVDDLWFNGKEKEIAEFEADQDQLTCILDLLKIKYLVDEIEPHSLLPFNVAVRKKHLPRIKGLEN